MTTFAVVYSLYLAFAIFVICAVWRRVPVNSGYMEYKPGSAFSAIVLSLILLFCWVALPPTMTWFTVIAAFNYVGNIIYTLICLARGRVYASHAVLGIGLMVSSFLLVGTVALYLV